MIINQDYLKIFPENCILQKEFFGENSQIKIKIIREFPKVNLIGGTFGPFSKKTTIKTFLWLGVFLEKTGFCEILNPSWFKLKWMDKNILKEKRETTLTNIPFNYIEISYIFFKKKTIHSNHSAIKMTLVEELYLIRFTKLWHGIKKIYGQINAIKFDKIGSIELETFKRVLQLILFLYFPA
mmetsp:Transcript_50943/g.103573  ORF Transcript_50943/g.103573 Transcript_50943/m.103573 type:complete len:182 (-) Transcript_50943:80-625(-)